MKYQATRFEQYTKYFWNGATFTTDAAKAKRFDSQQECFAELAEKKVSYFDHNEGRWIGKPVNCNPV